MFKLGQVFWIKSDRSDFECKVVETVVSKTIEGEKSTVFLVKQIRLNSYHVDYSPVEKRTHFNWYRYDHSTKQLEYFKSGFKSEGSWQSFEDKIFKTKPSKLRSGAWG